MMRMLGLTKSMTFCTSWSSKSYLLGVKGLPATGTCDEVTEPTETRDEGRCGMDGAGDTTRKAEGGGRPREPPKDWRPVVLGLVGVPGTPFRGVVCGMRGAVDPGGDGKVGLPTRRKDCVPKADPILVWLGRLPSGADTPKE